jgi:uncharacterized membrane protein
VTAFLTQPPPQITPGTNPPTPTSSPSTVRRHLPISATAAAALFVVYTTLSVLRHRALETSGFDLGIFEQEVRSYAHGHLPRSTLKGPGFPLLGDHFSPITATIAPIYRLAPSPITLLVVQAALLAIAVVPLTRWAYQRSGSALAVTVAAGYGLSWGIAQTVRFDFHEVAFAVPLLAFSVVALGEGRLAAAVWWAAPLVLVKEDLGLTLAVVGLLVAVRGKRLLGILTGVAGVLATVVETWVIIPAMNPFHRNDYVDNVHGGLLYDLTALVRPDTKIATVVVLLAPTAFLAVRSPLCLLAAPTLLWRFLSDNPVHWGTRYHYSAVLMPIVFAAFIDVMVRDRSRRTQRLAASVCVTALLIPGAPFTELASARLWSPGPAAAATKRLLDRIPDGVTVAASNWLAPQLTGRDDVSLFADSTLTVVRPEYIVVDTDAASWFPLDREQTSTLVTSALANGYRVVDQAGAVQLLRRTGS